MSHLEETIAVIAAIREKLEEDELPELESQLGREVENGKRVVIKNLAVQLRSVESAVQHLRSAELMLRQSEGREEQTKEFIGRAVKRRMYP